MKGRIPACCNGKAGHLFATSGDVSTYGEYNISEKLTDQGFLKGNRIGHNPLSPKIYDRPRDQKPLPPPLADVVMAIKEAYFNPKKYQDFCYHRDNKGLPRRQIRSEFRELLLLVLTIITNCYDAETGILGFENKKGISILYSYKQFAKKLNISLPRIKKAFGFLKIRGFVSIRQNRKKNQFGIWTSNIAEKFVKSIFFIRLVGHKGWLEIKKLKSLREEERRKMTPKIETEEQKENITRLKYEINSFLNKSRANKPTSMTTYPFYNKVDNSINKQPQKYRPPAYEDSSDPVVEKKLIEMVIDLHQRDPSKSPSEYLRVLKDKSKR